MEIIIVTGMSGAGKSGAIDCFEDLGYYCIDNLPPSLIMNFVNLIKQGKRKVENVVFTIDIRGGEFFDDLKTSLEELQDEELGYRILFLDASNEVLLRRFNETRRNHPLSADGSNLDALKKERELLFEVKKMSDYVIDTSNIKMSELHAEIKSLFAPEENQNEFKLVIRSFGFKYGVPTEVDMIFDMRFIPNPFYVSSLKNLTGNNNKVREYVMGYPESKVFKETVLSLVEELIPCYAREGKYNLKIAFGCTGGQHRSVTMANEFYETLAEKGYQVQIKHRDL